MSEWVWMRHRETGGVQRFNADSEKAWAARGWVTVPEPTDEEETEREGQRASEQGQDKPTRRTARSGGDAQE